jgi:tetraacyldisaccharide 4'-kinase
MRGIERADIIIITKSPRTISAAEIQQIKHHLRLNKKDVPLFFSTMRYGAHYPLFPQQALPALPIGKGSEILLVTGIAKPLPLKAELESRGAKVHLMQYADHHNFSIAELKKIASTFERMSRGCIIMTTEKDASRLVSHTALPNIIKENTYVIPIEVEILNNEENLLNKKISDYVTENSRDSIVP